MIAWQLVDPELFNTTQLLSHTLQHEAVDAQNEAIKASDLAMAAISSVSQLIQLLIAVVLMIVTVAAFFGWRSTVEMAERKAEEVARETAKSYFDSDSFNNELREKVRAEVERVQGINIGIGLFGPRAMGGGLFDLPPDEDP